MAAWLWKKLIFFQRLFQVKLLNYFPEARQPDKKTASYEAVLVCFVNYGLGVLVRVAVAVGTGVTNLTGTLSSWST